MAQQLAQCLDEKGNPVEHFKYDVITKIIYYSEMIDKENFRFSTGETDLNKAKKKAKARVAERFRKSADTASVTTLIRDEIEKVKKHYQDLSDAGDISPGTVVAAKLAFSKLEPFWGDLFPNEITKEKWAEYQTWFENQYGKQDQFNVKKFMSVLVTHLIERGLLLKKPTIRDRNAKRQREQRKKKKARVFTDLEIIALDDACKSDLERLGLRLAYMMGFRISDVVNLSWSRVHLDEKVPYINFTEGDDKADFSGKCPIPDDLMDIFRRMQASKTNPKWVFPKKQNPLEHWKTQSFDALWRAIKIRAKVNWGTFHGLRHYRLTKDFKNKEFTAMQVCMMRRVSLKTASEHYVHPEESDLELIRNAGSISKMRAEKSVSGNLQASEKHE